MKSLTALDGYPRKLCPARQMHSTLPKRCSSRGFTLTELLVVIAIVAIGATLALPDLGATLRRNRLQSATNELVSAINRTRVDASRTGASQGGFGVPHTMCASANSQLNDVLAAPTPSCTSGPALVPDAWTDGAIVFADVDGDGLRDSGEALVMSIPPAPSGLTITMHSAVVADPPIAHVLYAPNGKLHGNLTGVRFTVAPKGSPAADSRFVCLQGGGRPTELSYATLMSDSRYETCKKISPEVT